MKKLIAFLGFLLIIGLVGQASALTIDNPSFENDVTPGDGTILWDWTEAGDATFSQVLRTDSITKGTKTYDATDGEWFAELVGFDATISQSISWNAGDKLIFDWAFLDFDEDPSKGYYQIGDDINTRVYLGSSATGDTGWNTIPEITLGPSLSGNIIFGVEGFRGAESKLLVDNIRISSVPEPATMLLLGFGLIGIAGVGRKNRE